MALTRSFKETVQARVQRDPAFRDALLAEGAEKVYACATHPVLSGPAVERIATSRLEQLIVTNTIPLREDALKVEKIKVLSIAGLLGRAIESIHMETSVSTLFN